MHTIINTLVIVGAKYLLYIIIGIVFIWFLRQPRNRQKQIVVFGLVTSLVAIILARLAAHFYFDPRPFVLNHTVPLIPHSPDNGFPSDHVLLGSVIAFVIFYYYKKLGIILGVFAILIGVSRVFCQIHHFVDILGSIIIVFVAFLTIFYLILPWSKKTSLYRRFLN